MDKTSSKVSNEIVQHHILKLLSLLCRYSVLLPGEAGAAKPAAPLVHSFMTK